MTDWLSLTAAATLLGVHPSTVRAWADQGQLPFQRTAGRHRRFKRADVEAFAAARRDARPAESSGQLIAQNALGRARFQATEGRLRSFAWYQNLDEARRREFAGVGRTLLTALVRYLDNTNGDSLADAQAIGQQYDQLGRAAGLSLSEKVTLCLYFSDFLYDSVLDVYQASGPRAARHWAHLHRRVTTFTHAVLQALVVAHEHQEKTT